MNIAFINPRNDTQNDMDLSDVKSSSPPMALLNLAAVAKKFGHKVTVNDANALTRRCAKGSELVALTAMTINFDSACNMAKFIDIPVIIGGNHVTACSLDVTMNYPEFDKIFVGEGEWQFAEYLGHKLEPGLDSLPFPAFEEINLDDYNLSPFGSTSRRSIGLVTSRGCFGKCTFCSRCVFGNETRYHSAEYVLDLLDHLNKRYNVSDFLFYDDLFTGNRKRLIELCEKLTNRKYSWSCCSRVDTVNQELLKLMKRAGCWLIEYGIESADSDVLQAIKKHISLDKALETIKFTKQAGIRSKGNFIFGCPRETKESLQRTIDWACRSNLDYFQHTFMNPLPGSELYHTWKQFGSVKQIGNTFSIGFIPNDLKDTDLLYYSKLAWKRFYIRPRIIFNELRRLNWRRLVSGLKAFWKAVLR